MKVTNATQRISQPRTDNFFYNLPPLKDKPRCEITHEDGETFSAPAGKGWCELFTVYDLFENPTEEQKETFHGNWMKELFVVDKAKEKCNKFIEVFKKAGYREDEAREIIGHCFKNILRAKQTVQDLTNWGKIASDAASVTILFGFIKNIFSEIINNETYTPLFIKKVINLIYGLSRGIRSYFQGSIYSKSDDDIAKNKYEADVFDNKVSGTCGTLSGFVETKINPWALPLIELTLEDNYKDAIRKPLTSFTPAWFRGRMPAHIHQSFFTDIFRWLFHSIPALIGRNKSMEVLDGIKKRGNLNPSYIKKRLCILAGLTDEKDHNLLAYIFQIARLLKGTFSSDIKTQKYSARKFNEAIAAPLGVFGFFAMSTAAAIGSALKFTGQEERFFNFLYSSSITSQQFIYYPRLVVPIISEVKELETKLLNQEFKSQYSKTQLKELTDLYKKKKTLTYLGALCLILSFTSTSLNTVAFKNPILEKLQKISDELTNNLIQKFFSERRYLMGQDFMMRNPEYYIKENQEGVISELINQKEKAVRPEVRIINTNGKVTAVM